MSVRRVFPSLALALWLMVLGALPRAWADILNVTNLNTQQLQSVDTSTDTITPITNTRGRPDSLIFAPGNNIVYSLVDDHEIGIFNTITMSNTIVSGFGSSSQLRDLALEPSLTTVLVADFAGGAIDRVNLGTHAVTTLGSGYGSVDGITYDNAVIPNLFAVINNQTTVAQIDPGDGHIIRSIGGFKGLDGITFDPVTGKLWVSSSASRGGTDGLWAIPTDLSSAHSFAAGLIADPDGLESDGKGNIFLAGANQIYEYNIAGDSTASLTAVFGIDDLAPIVGLGSPPQTLAVPEPSSLLMLAIAMAAVFFAGWRWIPARAVACYSTSATERR